MELLLNLAWLLLALPAYWLIRRRVPGSSHAAASLVQCTLALACALFLLFPIISATDDVHVMRSEMEEPGAGKRAVRQTTGDTKSVYSHQHSSSAAVLAPFALPPLEASDPVIETTSARIQLPENFIGSGRAPPSVFLG